MRWGDARRSDNVDEVSGSPGLRIGGLGLGGTIVVVVFSLAVGVNPLEMLGLVNEVSTGVAPPQESRPATSSDRTTDFVRAILGETEDVWGAIFEQAGKTYERPKLSLFSGGVRSACGTASSAMGPFYCPRDHHVYLDRSFFQEMRAHLGGGGVFTQQLQSLGAGHHLKVALEFPDAPSSGRSTCRWPRRSS